MWFCVFCVCMIFLYVCLIQRIPAFRSCQNPINGLFDLSPTHWQIPPDSWYRAGISSHGQTRHKFCTNRPIQEALIADGPRDALSVSILSTVETSCTTNQQQIAMIDLEGYSWSTCSKQPPLADCRIGIVNKLDRQWRQQRVLLTTRSTCRGEIFEVWSRRQSYRGKYLYLYWKKYGDAYISS